MKEKELDCRGLACPNPVMKTRDILQKEDPDKLIVIVDNPAARENVSRFMGKSGLQVSIAETGDDFAVIGVRQGSSSGAEIAREGPSESPREEASPISHERRTVVLLANDRLGKGDDELGRKLVLNFLASLQEMKGELWRLILLNAGVKLSVQGSDVLPALIELEKEGVGILVCGTCLQHFGIYESKAVGETTNMMDVVSALQFADKVISLT